MASMGGGDRLPPDFAGPVARLMALRDNPDATLRFEAGAQVVELVLVGPVRRDEGEGREVLVRLNLIREGADLERLRDRYGLTQREAEVLLWISYGKPNRVISEILGISPRTVNKHLEQVFEKLGVETRAAAAAFAVRTIA